MSYEDDFHPIQIAAIRKTTPGERLDTAVEMILAARRFQAEAIEAMHPDWSPEQVQAEVRRRWIHAQS